MSTTEVLRCLILSPTPPSFRSARRPCCSCRGCWPPNDAVAELAHAGARWAATGRRSWCCAGSVMALGWPSWPPTTGSAARRPTGICTRASTPSPPGRRGCAARCWPPAPPGTPTCTSTAPWSAPIAATCRPTARTDGSDRRVDLWWSGKHAAHGGNVQVVTVPDGWPIWTSPVRPGREHDTTALRTHAEALPLLTEWTDEAHAALGDLGYEGAQATLTIPIKRTADRPLTDDQRTVNALHAATRALAERGNALLKTTFKALRRVSLCPWRIGAITAAALVLLHHEHGHTT